MAKLDELKEILNTLRVSLSLVVGLIVILTGALISKEQSGLIDVYFWLGILIELVLLGVFVKIIFKIKQHTREIKDL